MRSSNIASYHFVTMSNLPSFQRTIITSLVRLFSTFVIKIKSAGACTSMRLIRYLLGVDARDFETILGYVTS